MTKKTNPVKEATFDMFRRYNGIMQKKKYRGHDGRLTLMAIHAISHPEYPVDKLNRWLGFIQGVLYAEGFIDLEEEREVSRKLYAKAYEAEGIEMPKSVDVVQDVIDSWE